MRTLHSLVTVLALSFSTLGGCATTGAYDDVATAEDEAASAGKLALWQANDGQWHFHLKSGNGAILLTSEAYTSRTGAINGALSTLDNGVDPAQYKLSPATHGYVLHLVAGNNEVISFSQVYATRSSATRAITSCVRATTSYLDKREAVTTGARVAVEQGAESGQFHFNMFAKNGQIVVSSESYTTEAAAYNGAFAVQAEGQAASAYTVKANAAGTGFYFTVKANNGQIIGTSQQYTTRASAETAVTATMTLMPQISVL
ncbi:MAG: YegP family protein [Proteobacteria bacterium]|nr:YegP family protein [Pseudomonadota bacterium]